jgi:hypothetical protein
MQRQATGNTSHRGWPYAKTFNGGVGGFPQARVVRQAEVIVGAQI